MSKFGAHWLKRCFIFVLVVFFVVILRKMGVGLVVFVILCVWIRSLFLFFFLISLFLFIFSLFHSLTHPSLFLTPLLPPLPSPQLLPLPISSPSSSLSPAYFSPHLFLFLSIISRLSLPSIYLLYFGPPTFLTTSSSILPPSHSVFTTRLLSKDLEA